VITALLLLTLRAYGIIHYSSFDVFTVQCLQRTQPLILWWDGLRLEELPSSRREPSVRTA